MALVENARARMRIPKKSSHSTQAIGKNLVAHSEIGAKTRIVVVRTTSSRGKYGTDSSSEETPDTVRFPALLTDGRTSVYVIRRPIPQTEGIIETKLYQRPGEKSSVRPAKKENDNGIVQDVDEHDSAYEKTIPSSQIDSSSNHRKDPTSSSNYERSEDTHRDPKHSPSEQNPALSDAHSTESYERLITTPIHLNTSQAKTNEGPLENDAQNLNRLDSKTRQTPKRRSRSRRRKPEKSRSPSPADIPHEETNVDKSQPLHTSSAARKNAQTSLISPKTVENNRMSVLKIGPTGTRNSQRRTSITRIKSSKSIFLVNPEDQSIAVVENPYVPGEVTSTVIKHPKTSSKTQYEHQLLGNSYTEVHRSRNACVDCISRRMCLVITICIIVVIIGLAGVGVSAYFLASNSSTNMIPKAVGLAVGSVIALVGLVCLSCVIGCLCCRDGYSSNDKDLYSGRENATPISPSQTNVRFPSSRENTDFQQKYPPPFLRRTSNEANYQFKPTMGNIRSKINDKNMTIQMPEILLTGRKFSPKSQQRKVNNVVSNIGLVVQDAKRRYHGDVPSKVVVQVDEAAKPYS